MENWRQSTRLASGELEKTSIVKNSDLFLIVDNISVGFAAKLVLKNITWQIKNDEQWAILGPNGSGKTTLMKALWGGIATRIGNVQLFINKHPIDSSKYKKFIGYISFELHQNLATHEAFQEELRAFSHKENKATTAKDVILSGISVYRKINADDNKLMVDIAEKLNITYLLSREITALSSGEMRKTLIARALMKSPKLLILDEPFDGLDEKSKNDLSSVINNLAKDNIHIILITHRVEEIVPNISHILFLKNGEIFAKGEKEKLLTAENLSNIYEDDVTSDNKYLSSSVSNQSERSDPYNIPDILIEMKDVNVKYGKTIVLSHFNWIMKKGEDWAILGPNGVGKSTIVKLITGDNLQGYANKIKIFDIEKGTGETVWEIKKHIGIISSELQIQYRKNMNSYDVIASGFYDSIGLYHYPTKEEEKRVDKWIEILQISDLAKRNYSHLSYGQKRMILLARAMVKSPTLLILDEPCHGLDMVNRKRILDIIETIGETDTHLLYITHHKEEILPPITNILHLDKKIKL
ncbi:ATP-binding cassette domain-containing protein [Candidatus Gottesmanbacteria bacterium]|nr:ATP-binding cassette domain-containing protein [Candidatus Gottesmanbacteria bacterium]